MELKPSDVALVDLENKNTKHQKHLSDVPDKWLRTFLWPRDFNRASVSSSALSLEAHVFYYADI